MSTERPPTVLVVDDEERLVELFVAWLSDEYAVRTASGGEEAIESLDDDVDVLLLDRRMPDLSGDEVLERVRDRELDCHVSMVTAVEPDVDVLETGFDEYLVKPFSREELREVVETLLTRKEHESAVQRYFRLVSKRAALESGGDRDPSGPPMDEVPEADIEALEADIEALEADIEALEADIEALVTDLGDSDFEAQLHRIERGVGLGDGAPADAGSAP